MGHFSLSAETAYSIRFNTREIGQTRKDAGAKYYDGQNGHTRSEKYLGKKTDLIYILTQG